MPNIEHLTQQNENNRCELSHQPTRQQGRHMMKAKNYRILMERSFNEWDRVSCVRI